VLAYTYCPFWLPQHPTTDHNGFNIKPVFEPRPSTITLQSDGSRQILVQPWSVTFMEASTHGHIEVICIFAFFVKCLGRHVRNA
jgi:hypothetical protein